MRINLGNKISAQNCEGGESYHRYVGWSESNLNVRGLKPALAESRNSSCKKSVKLSHSRQKIVTEAVAPQEESNPRNMIKYHSNFVVASSPSANRNLISTHQSSSFN